MFKYKSSIILTLVQYIGIQKEMFKFGCIQMCLKCLFSHSFLDSNDVESSYFSCYDGFSLIFYTTKPRDIGTANFGQKEAAFISMRICTPG